MQLVKPKALRHGDAISVIAPAGPVVRERIEKAFERLRSLGYRVKTHGDVFRACGYLAGDDSTRAAELMAAFADPESTAVWCARGGYGVARILDRLDYDIVKRHPKVFVGFSDVTALHLAIQNRTGLVTFHGPNLQDGFGAAEGMSSTTEAALWRMIALEQQNSTAKQLDLDADQTAQVEKIVANRQVEIVSIRRRFQPEILQQLNSVRDEIAAVLTEPQREKWTKLFGQFQQRWLPPAPPASN